MGAYKLRQDGCYSVLLCTCGRNYLGAHFITASFLGKDEGIHIEVLLPAFVLGMVWDTLIQTPKLRGL